MFNKTYSKGSVMRAGAAIETLNDCFEFQIKKFPVEGLPTLSDVQLHNGISDAIFNPDHKHKATLRTSFTNGAMNVILRHSYDGNPKHFDSFCKEAFKAAFDKGFMMNHGKLMYKGFNQTKHISSKFWVLGEKWGEAFIERMDL